MKYLLPLLLVLNVVINGNENETDVISGNLEGFVVGGVNVPILMYPHIAQIFYKNQVCGGSIISDRVIVTAAHCLYDIRSGLPMNAKKIIVQLGSDELKVGVKYRGCKAIIHEKYNKKNRKTFYYYDIGLILLSKSIKFGPTIKKVDIAKSEEFRNVNHLFTIAGFGVISNSHLIIPAKKLKATRMYYVKTKTCNESQSFLGIMNVPDHMFCMIGHGWTSDCFGDSGSGIIWRRLLVGIVSTGRDNYCGSDVLPSMYIDLVYFRKWVTAKVIELESTPAEKCQRSTRKSISKRKLNDE